MATKLEVSHKKWIQHFYGDGDDHSHFQDAGFPAISSMGCVEGHNLPSQTAEITLHYPETIEPFETLHMPFTSRVAEVLVATF